MAWLQDEGDENELAPFEEEEDGEQEGITEDIEEEVIVTERPGGGSARQPSPATRSKSKKKAKSKPKARPKKKATPKKKKSAAKAGKRRTKRGRR